MVKKKKNIFFNGLFFFVLLNSIDLVANNDINASLYEKVGNLVLESESYIAKPINNQNEEKKPETLDEILKEFLNPLNDKNKKQITYNLFNLNGNYCSVSTVLEDYSLRELNIFGSGLSKNNLFEKINKTVTVFGSILLSRIISEPHIDRKLLLGRQKIIKYLINNEHKFNEIEKQIQKIKKYENDILKFWTNSGALIQWQPIARKPYAFRILRALIYGALLINPVAGLASSIGLATLNYSFTAKIKSSLLWGLCVGAVFVLPSIASYLGFKQINEVWYSIWYRMLGVNKVIKAINKLHVMLSEEEGFIGSFKLKEQLLQFAVYPDKVSSQLEILKELLVTNSWGKKPHWTMDFANVVVSYRYMHEIKQMFLGALEAVGEIDAYMSIAKLLKEFETKKVGYCFVEYINNSEPVMLLKDVWNPLIDISSVVTEDIALCKPDFAHNIMLTGPHGGGKSTFMKSLLYTLILGQTFGIAPARKAMFTIFDKINTYVNIKEDLAQGQSTFMAEKKRVDEISNCLKNLKENEKAFSIMDEVFKGTMEDEGSIRVYKFGKEIAPIKNSMCLIATHFRKPADLEEDTNNEWTNYHVGLEEQGDHTFLRTFKLIPGKNEWWFNDKEKRERYIDWLTSIN